MIRDMFPYKIVLAVIITIFLVFGITLILLLKEGYQKTPAPQNPVIVETFCRDVNDDITQKTIEALYAKGFSYKGPLNNDGINCTRVLFQTP